MKKKLFALCLCLTVCLESVDAQDLSVVRNQLIQETDSLNIAFESRPLISIYDKSEGALEILNISREEGFRLVAEQQCECETVKRWEFPLDDLKAYGSVRIPLAIDGFPEWKDTYLNLYYYSGDILVTSEQVLVDKKYHHRTADGGTVKIDECDGKYQFQGTLPQSGILWSVGINTKTGFIDTYKIDGKELLAVPVHPSDWKPTDVAFVLLNNNGTVIVNSSKGMLIYATSGDGTVFVSLQDSRSDTITGALASDFVNTEYYGRGPCNCYEDGVKYGRIDRYEQKPGWGHNNMKLFSFADESGKGLVFESDSDFMAMTALEDSQVDFSLTFLYGVTDFYLYPCSQKH